MAGPYDYPQAAHIRRHGPTGYASYKSYLPWLQDEFLFRCVYCLKRMIWAPTDIWAIDHLVSQKIRPDLACEYDNLVLACQFCNSQKGSRTVPDPCEVAYGSCLSVGEDGVVVPHSKFGERIIKSVCLNHKQMKDERVQTIEILKVLAEHHPDEYRRRLAFPASLPDLTDVRRRPPSGNRRPEGVFQSCFARRSRNELPDTY